MVEVIARRNLARILRNLVADGQDVLHNRIELYRRAFRGGQVQHIDLPQLIRRAALQISKVAFLRVRSQYGDRAGCRDRLILPFVVYQEEYFFLEPTKVNQWSTEVSSVVLRSIEHTLQTLSISGPRIGVEPFALRLIESAAMVVFAAAPRGELDVCAALGAGVCTETAGFHGDFFDCSQTNR